MITKWCIIVSDIEEENFFVIGPFDSKTEADDFDDNLMHCSAITSIHPWIKGLGWIGKARRKSKHILEEEI